jgi:hypothetical protein
MVNGIVRFFDIFAIDGRKRCDKTAPENARKSPDGGR